jgi:hypothetical protein
MLFDFVPVTYGRWLPVTSRSTIPDSRGFLIAPASSVSAKINLANSTSRNSVSHLLVSVAGSSNPVGIHYDRSVDLERTDSQSSVSNSVVSSVRLHGN